MSTIRSRTSDTVAQKQALDAIAAVDAAQDAARAKRRPAGKAQTAYVKERLSVVPEALARVRNRLHAKLTPAERREVERAVLDGAPEAIVPALKAAIGVMIEEFDDTGDMNRVHHAASMASITIGGEMPEAPAKDPNRPEVGDNPAALAALVRR